MSTSLHNTSRFLKNRKSRRPVGKPRQPRLSQIESLEERVVFNTYWASNLNDDGRGSLRTAIETANFHSGADDIRFRGSMKGTITLSSELSITDDLTIHGQGHKVTVSGGGTTRVVNIGEGADVTIKHLKIANGRVTDGDGGGILNQGNLLLLDSVVSGNSAGFGGGGGIKSVGNLTIQRSRITDNAAFQGHVGRHIYRCFVCHSAGNQL